MGIRLIVRRETVTKIMRKKLPNFNLSTYSIGGPVCCCIDEQIVRNECSPFDEASVTPTSPYVKSGSQLKNNEFTVASAMQENEAHGSINHKRYGKE